MSESHEPKDETRTLPPGDPDATRTRVQHDPDATKSTERIGPAPGKVEVPGYLIEATLGVGGMGVVYKAVQLKLNRPVALKMVLGGSAAGAREVRRFLAEAEAVAAIDHPHIVRVFESGEVEGRPYLAMEYLSAGSLADRIKKNGRSEPREAADLVRRLALAVQAAHERQVVHRDLKPSNVLFDATGEPRITDFGLAKKGTSDLTLSNAIMGTPAYMAPEQAKGESKFVGPAADIWALGVILYESLTGAKPFSGVNELEVLRKVAEEEPSSLRSRVSAVPRDLELIAQKCLSKEPEARYETAAALAEDLRRWKAGESVSVKAATPAERAVKWVRRNKLATGIIAASVAGVVVAGSLAVYAHQQRRNAQTSETRANERSDAADKAAALAAEKAGDAERESRNAKLAHEELQKQAREQRKLLDLARLRDAQLDYEANLVAHARDTLDAIAPENRCAGWALMKRVSEGSLFTIYGHRLGVNCVAWSPDGRRIASGGDDHTVRIWDAATGAPLLKLEGHTGSVQAVAWSPDNSRLASAGDSVRLWDPVTGKSAGELKGNRNAVTTVAWSPDGRRLLSCGDDKTVSIWNADSRALHKPLIGHTGTRIKTIWSHDGRQVLSVSLTDQNLKFWNAETGECLETRPFHPGAQIALHPGNRFLGLAGSYNIQLLHAATGEHAQHVEGLPGEVMSLAWSPDGLNLAAGSSNHSIGIWDYAVTPTAPRLLRGHTNGVKAVSWSPDGRFLVSASADCTLRIWDARMESNAQVFRSPHPSTSAVAWSADGTRLVGRQFKALTAWNADSGQILWQVPLPEQYQDRLRLSPDGRRIAVADEQQHVRVYDAANGALVFSVNTAGPFTGRFEWRPDSRHLAVTNVETIALYDADTGKVVRQLGEQKLYFYNQVHWLPDNRTLLVSDNTGAVLTLDAEKNRKSSLIKEHPGGIMALAVSADGRRAAIAGGDRTLRIYDLATGAVQNELRGHAQTVHSMSWSPDGQRLATANYERAIRLWDTGTGRKLFEIRTDSQVSDIAWSRDGRRLACATPHHVRVWDLAEFESARQLEGHEYPIDFSVYSRDGRLLISMGSLHYRIWNPHTGQLLPKAKLPEQMDLSFAPTGDFDYIPNGKTLLQVPLTVTEPQQSRRRMLLRADPEWHRETARQAESRKDHFAAAHHSRRVLVLAPDDAEAKACLAVAKRNLQIHELAPPPRKIAP